MAESSERTHTDFNTFKEGMDSKSIEKEAINVAENEGNIEDCLDSSQASIAYDIDEDIASIQAVAVMEAAKTVKGAANNIEEAKPNNLEIEAALNNTFVTDVEDSASDSDDHTALTECQRAGLIAKKTSEDIRVVFDMGQDLMETLTSTIEVLHSHVRAFSEKAVQAEEQGTEHGYQTANFYRNMTSKYEASVESLEKRARNVEVALSRCEQAINECRKYATMAEGIVDDTLDESKRIKFSACWWINKGKAVIIVTLKKKRAALLTMRRMWLGVREDMEYEERQTASEDSDDEETQQQCENRDRKTKVGHVVGTLLGIALLSVTCLFPVGSDSFSAILALGLLTLGWCIVYWSHKLYMCVTEQDKEIATPLETARGEDRFLTNCERRLKIVNDYLGNYNITMDGESDSSSLETVRVGDTSR